MKAWWGLFTNGGSGTRGAAMRKMPEPDRSKETSDVMRHISVVVVMVAAAFATWAQGPAVTGSGKTSLDNLVRTGQMVTVVIKGTNARDTNLQVADVQKEFVAFNNNRGDRITYLRKDILEIQVQEGQVEDRSFRPISGVGLLPIQQQVLEQAMSRLDTLFLDTSSRQNIKLDTAALLAVAGSQESQGMAREYIEQLHNSNDLATALYASRRMYLSGNQDAISTKVLEDSLQSGNQIIRQYGAIMSGLTGYRGAVPHLYRMMRDRRPDLSAPAIVALARLGHRDIMPDLYQVILERNPRKADAAAFALTRLGSQETIEELKVMLQTAEGLGRFRIVKVLFDLDDPDGQRILRDELMVMPTLEVEAAVLLARKGDVRAMRILRNRLDQRYDEVEAAMLLRARMAAAVLAGGDRTAIAALQELLRKDSEAVQVEVCRLVADLNIKSLTTIIQPPVESSNPRVAVEASQSAIAMAYPDFRDRLLEYWIE
jgi:HEAT repeat protein